MSATSPSPALAVVELRILAALGDDGRVAETEQRVERSWQSAEPHQEVLANVAKGLASVGGRVDVGRQTVSAVGGRAGAYRVLGSNFPGVSRWMPWSALAHVVPDEAAGAVRVRLAVVSDQGYYVHQGGRTARKWQARLSKIADAAYTDER